MITYRRPMLAMLFMLSVGDPVRSQDHHEEKHHHKEQAQEAHIHGLAKLLVVLEGEQLEIELHSPAMNLLGFEHRASTPEQQALVKNAKNTLANANRLFTFGLTQCQLIDHDVDISRMLDESVHHDKDHHDEKHDLDHHDRHEEYDHSNIEARYHYRCARPDQLGSLRTSIPVEFPGIESLQVQWIINGRQGATTLDNIRHHLNFK